MKIYRPHISSLGDAAANFVAVFCYLCALLLWNFSFVPILCLFFYEKKSGLVRFHAIQALLLWLTGILLGAGLTFEGLAALLTGSSAYLHTAFSWMSGPPVVLARAVIGGAVGVFAVCAISRAYRWESWRIPVIGAVSALIYSHCRKAIYTGGDGPPPHGCEYFPHKAGKAGTFNGASYYQDTAPPAPPPTPDIAPKQEETPRRRTYPQIPDVGDANSQIPEYMRDPAPKDDM